MHIYFWMLDPCLHATWALVELHLQRAEYSTVKLKDAGTLREIVHEMRDLAVALPVKQYGLLSSIGAFD